MFYASTSFKASVICFLCLITQALFQELPEEIVLFATYRDFLPSRCLVDVGNELQVNISWNTDVTERRLSQNAQRLNGCQRLTNSTLLPGNEIYKDALFDGIISGHPDFEAAGLFSNQNQCTAVDPESGLNFPVGTCVFQEGGLDHTVVSHDLVVQPNGIPQVQYCTGPDGEPQSRCGFVGALGFFQTQSTKENFDLWYNDNPKFNKRVGQKIVLTLANATEGLYTFVDNGNESPDFQEPADNNLDFFGPLDIFKVDRTREVTVDVEIEDAPAWPQSNNDNFRSGFWFTSEIHTTFEFREDSKMEFTFSGDDDFWAFINGRLAVDVGGMHSERRQTIDLNDGNGTVTFADLLGLEDGGIFTLDIFHAERQETGSNFLLETTLFAACNVLQSGESSFSITSGISEEDFDATFVRQGVVQEDSQQFQILSENDLFSSTFIFTENQENLGPGFQAKFGARIDGDTDGFAFVIQAQGTQDYPRSSGKSFNFAGVSNSLAVVFDLCKGRDDENNCVGQDVRIHFPNDPNSPNNADLLSAEDGGTLRVFDDIVRNLKRDEAFPVEIVYFGGRPYFLEVYVNNSLTLRQSNFDLEAVIGGTGAHVGFTVGSSDKAANIFIENFELTIVAVDPRRTNFVANQNNTQTVIADGESFSEGFVIFTEDLCTNTFESGTLDDDVTAFYVEQPNLDFGSQNGRRLQDGEVYSRGANATIVEANVVDNFDGTYALQLQTDIVADFQLVMAFGANCDIDFVEAEVVVEDDEGENVTIIVPVPLLKGDINECSFVDDFDGSLSALEPEVPPTSSPIAFEQNNNEVNVIIFAGTGGGVFFLVILAAILFFVYRQRWKKNEGYVAPGNAYKLEMNTVLQGGEEYTTTGKALLASQTELLELQSKAKDDTRSNEIKKLQKANSEMKNIIKGSKADNYAGAPPASVLHSMSSSSKKKDKMEF